MAEKTKPPAGDGKKDGDAGASGTDVSVHKTGHGKITHTRNKDGEEVLRIEDNGTTFIITGKLSGGGKADGTDKVKAGSTPPADPTAPAKSPEDCLKIWQKVQDHNLKNLKKTAKFVSKLESKGYKKGRKSKKCCSDKKATDGQDAYDKEVQSSGGKSWVSWIGKVLTVAIVALLAFLLLSELKGCGALGGGDATPATTTIEETRIAPPSCIDCVDSLTNALRREFDRREGSYVPEPSEHEFDDDLEDPSQNRKPSATPQPTPASTRQFQAANADLALMVLDCLGKDPNLLRFVGDSLDGEQKKILLAGVLATAVANGKDADFSGPRPKLVDASYALGTNRFCEQMGFQAHEVVRYGKYEGSEVREESLNYWANLIFDALQHMAETEFSVAVDETLQMLHQALIDRGWGQFYGIQVAQTTRKRHTSGGSALASAPSKGGATRRGGVFVPGDFYKLPVKGANWDDNHWDGKANAVDMFADKGTPVRASASGRVIRSGDDGGKSGNRVTIRDQYTDLLYAHLDQIYARNGQWVNQGDIIGTVGNTGSAKGGSPHLHFEFWRVRKGVKAPRPWEKWKKKVRQQRRT